MSGCDGAFWAQVDIRDDNECWNWTGYLRDHTKVRRGHYRVNNKAWITSRYAWYLTHGDIPEGMFVCHTCDNGLCCNPNHLFLGTPKDNTQDMIRKGRKVIQRGEDDPKSKLTWEQVREIRRRWEEGNVTQPSLGRQYGVSRSAIESIVLFHNWKEAR